MAVTFEVSNTRAFAKSIEAIKKVVEEVACFEAKSDAVRIQQMDPGHVALARMSIDRRDLKEYSFGREGDYFCFSLESMDKVLKRARKEDDTVRISDAEDTITVEFPRTRRMFKIDRKDEKLPELPDPQIRFTAKAEVASSELKKALGDVEGVGDTVRFEADQDFKLSTKGDKGEYQKTFSKGDIGLLRLESTEPTSAMYSRLYLDDIIHTAFDTVVLNWAKDMPLRAGYQIMPRSRLEFLIAPRIEAE